MKNEKGRCRSLLKASATMKNSVGRMAIEKLGVSVPRCDHFGAFIALRMAGWELRIERIPNPQRAP